MPVCHIVLLKTRAGVNHDDMASIRDAWRDSILKIPGVISADFGRIHSPDPQGYSHMVHITLENPEAAAAFGPHPEHMAAGSLMKDMVEGVLIADLHEADDRV